MDIITENTQRAHAVGTVEKLPTPSQKGTVSLEETLAKRHSVRIFSNKNLSREQIGQLLWAAQGINRPDKKFRTCPSAGATFPLETFIVIPEGVYHYGVADHSISLVRKGDFRKELSGYALGQQSVAQAPLSIIFCAVFSRTTNRYGERGKMFVHMEAGHAAQNVHLQAVSLGLGSVPVGAFEEEKVKKFLECANNTTPLYIIPVGYEK